jgi:dihydrofolate synthase/folylpolyglutamate synthase
MAGPAEYAAAVAYLYGQKARGVKFGIDRMRVLAAALGNPERNMPVIHIAGTNGKGSVAAMVESILRAAGWRTGLYTSPHLIQPGERVQVDRRALTAAEVVAYLKQLRPIAEQIGNSDPDLQPSFFEYMTAMAFLQFSRAGCDIAVVEVGLGGRLDATNIVTPEVSVITSIGLDHCEILGNTFEQIAAEKAGIIKAGRPVVLGRMPHEAAAAIRATAARLSAPVISVRERYGEAMAGYPDTSLAGDYQRWNAATAVEAVRALAPRWNISAAAIATGLGTVAWPGRWQQVQLGGKRLVLDASHNPEGATVLDANLSRLRAETGREPIVIVGVLGTVRAEPLLQAISRHARAIHLVMVDQPRATAREDLRKLVPDDYRGAVELATVSALFPGPGVCTVGDSSDVIVVTGSIYLLGEVMTRLAQAPMAPG